MALMDQQDNFSSISWHSDHNNAGTSSSSASYDIQGHDDPSGGPQEQQQQEREAEIEQLGPGLGGEILECTVSEPHKENDGTKDAYVSYMITTNVSLLP